MSETKIEKKRASSEIDMDEIEENLISYHKLVSYIKQAKKATKSQITEKEKLEKFFKAVSTSNSEKKFKLIKTVEGNAKYRQIKFLSDLVRKIKKNISYVGVKEKEVLDIIFEDEDKKLSSEESDQVFSLVKEMNFELQNFTSALNLCSDMTRKFNKLVELDAVEIPNEINELIDAYGFYSAVKFMGDDVKVSDDDYKRNKSKLEYLMKIISNPDEFFMKINDKIYKKSFYELNVLTQMLRYKDITEYRRYKEISDKSPLYIKYSQYLYSGRRKLIVSDLFSIFHFFTTQSDIQKSELFKNVIVYAGSSPGSHIPLIMRIFGSKIHKMLLFDTSPIHENLKHYIERQSEGKSDGKEEKKVIHHSSYLTQEHISLIKETYKSRTNILLLSDIRTTDKGKVGNKEIISDMALQKTFFEDLKPTMAVFKFKLPYPEKKLDQNFDYYDGDIFMQCWTKPFSSETRLIIKKDAKIIPYSLEEYEKKMFFFNTDIRVQKYTFEDFKRERINMFDFVGEMFILDRIAKIYNQGGVTAMDIHEEINKLLGPKVKSDIENEEYVAFREELDNFLHSSPKAPKEILTENNTFEAVKDEDDDVKIEISNRDEKETRDEEDLDEEVEEVEEADDVILEELRNEKIVEDIFYDEDDPTELPDGADYGNPDTINEEVVEE